jgi:tetratricopeptide (TPR) repeat protein
MTTRTLIPGRPAHSAMIRSAAPRLLGVALALASIMVGSRIVSDPRSAVEPAAPGWLAPVAGDGHVLASGLEPPDERVAFWEPRVAAHPTDYLSAFHLADAYLDRARASGDLNDLERARSALERAAEHAPDAALGAPRQALVAFSLHDFGEALRVADEILAASPDHLTALGVAADARVEIGDLAGAHPLYDRLAALAPSPPVWSRLARLAFLEGDAGMAAALAQRAIVAADADGFPDEAAFYRFQLGELYRASGEVDDAGRAYEAALRALPDYPAAAVGLALVREAQGLRPEAIALLQRAIARLPTPDAVAALGDLYLLDGDEELANRQYATVERIAELARATGSVYDRQYVLFAADHEHDTMRAVALAEAELATRRDVYAYDAYAWALYRAGRLDEAAEAATAALALGTPDPRIRYHAGMIAAAQGHDADARRLLGAALDGAAFLPPLQVPTLEAALAGLSAETNP